METVSITFTAGEAQALLQLIHHAIMAKGMEVAEAGVHLAKKIQAAAAVKAAEPANAEAPAQPAAA